MTCSPPLDPLLGEDPSDQPIAHKGHVLHATPTGSTLFCVKCGKKSQHIKHLRLKIPDAPCQHADLPESQWLSEPARHLGTFKHTRCSFVLTTCGCKWPWAHQHSCPQATFHAAASPPTRPAWVDDLQRQSPQTRARPKERLRRKTAMSNSL